MERSGERGSMKRRFLAALKWVADALATSARTDIVFHSYCPRCGRGLQATVTIEGSNRETVERTTKSVAAVIKQEFPAPPKG